MTIKFDYATTPSFTSRDQVVAWLRAWREEYARLTDRIHVLKRWSAALHRGNRVELAAIDQRELSFKRYVAGEMMKRRTEASALTRAHAAQRRAIHNSIAA